MVFVNGEKLYSGDAVTSLSGLGLNNFFTATSAGLPQPVKKNATNPNIAIRRIDFFMFNASLNTGFTACLARVQGSKINPEQARVQPGTAPAATN